MRLIDSILIAVIALNGCGGAVEPPDLEAYASARGNVCGFEATNFPAGAERWVSECGDAGDPAMTISVGPYEWPCALVGCPLGATCTTRLPCVDGPPCGDDLPAYVGRCEVQPGSGR